MTSIVGLNASNLDIRRWILRTQIFWQLTRQSLLMRLTPWRKIAGSTPQNQSLCYSTVQSISRLYTQHSNFEAQLEPNRLPISPPYLLITMSNGTSSILPSTHITYLRVCSTPT
jgi:hypothetical protein